MKTEDIDILIARFYQGETEENEEKLLVEYFTVDNTSADYKTDSTVLHSLSEETEVPQGLENKISSLIDSWEEGEKSKTEKIAKLEFRKRILSIAASLLLIVSIGIWYQYNSSVNSEMVNTFEDPQESHEVVVEALRLFSNNFSKGTQTIEKADNRVDNTFKIVEQVLSESPVQE
ncbi:MAG: hypothetical protein PHV53_05450 [Fermentimonas sp.]|nr:hypothetical protein [Fermentimonas sp.]